MSESSAMQCTVRWSPGVGMAFIAESGSGHLIAIDGAPEGGGRDLAPRPMELLLAGAGGCTAYDVVTILRRGRHDIRACDVRIEADRADSEPRVFTHMRVHYIVGGRGLPASAVARAIELSHEKYCSATIMLGKTVRIAHSHEIVEV